MRQAAKGVGKHLSDTRLTLGRPPPPPRAPTANRPLRHPSLFSAPLQIPAYLDRSLPGDYGCDPFGLAKEPQNLARYSEAELMHARWAMLAWAGMIAVELEPNAPGGWKEAALWFRDGAAPTYVGESVPLTLGSVVGVQVVTMAISERKRAQSDAELRKYPGGRFDPLNLAEKLNIDDMKTKEIANGRVAMLAVWGCVAQGFAIGGTPLSNLGDHLADPGHANLVGNGGIPWLLYGL